MAEQEIKKLNIAAVGDIHVQQSNVEYIRQLFQDISEHADVLLLCGDLTQTGSVEEAKLLAHELRTVNIPVIGVLGNHDYHLGNVEEISQILSECMTLLNGTQKTVGDIGIAGVKGFGGGFDRYMVSPFGEPAMKNFVREVEKEVTLLDQALRSMYVEKKIVLLHYSPIIDTIRGESTEIYPFMGSSRFIKAIDDNNVQYVFHGHAHHGTHEGKTPGGVKVYNCAYPLMRSMNTDRHYVLVTL